MKTLLEEEAPVTEPRPAQRIYVSGCAAVEIVDTGVAMWTLYCNSPDGSERQVELYLLAPVTAIPHCVKLTVAAARKARRQNGRSSSSSAPHGVPVTH